MNRREALRLMGATAVVAPFGRLVAQEAADPGEQRTKDRLIGEYLGRWICLLPTKLGGGAHAYDMATGKTLAWIS